MRAWFEGGWREATPLRNRAEMQAGDAIDGPAIIVEANATTVLEPGWRAEISQRRDLLLSRVLPRPAAQAIGTNVDPVMLEIFNNLFMSIAEQMGAALANTAQSVNIKERLDFSCAVFDRDGGLVANAPHLPVRRIDGRKHRDGHPRARRHDAAGRCVRPQRAVQRRHAPAGYYRDHACVRRSGR